MPGTQTGHVFISYSRKDDVAMRRIVKYLRIQGIVAWVDNEKLVPGTPIWEYEIEKAIRGAFAIVVILSPDAKSSEWVLREITLADQFHKRVFPILVGGTDEDSIPLRLITRQFVDLRKDETTGLNSLSTAISFYSEELSRIEEERLAAEREAARLKMEREVAEKAARGAREKAEAEKQAGEEAERLAITRTEEERVSKAKLKEKRLAKEERGKKQSVKDGRTARQILEGEQPSKEKTALAKILTRFASMTKNQGRSTSARLVFGVVGILTIAVFGIGYGILFNLGNGNSQSPPAVSLTNATPEELIVENPTKPVAPNLGDQIIQRGTIRIGVRGDTVWPFDIIDGSSHTGFDIDLAEEIVKRLFNDQVSIEWLSLTAAERHTALQSGEIDMLVRGYVHMTSREDFGLWTSNYFLDGVRIMVPIDSGIDNIEDLNGGTIAVTSGTTSEVILQDTANVAGIEYEPVIFEESSATYKAFVEGRADALIGEWSYLLFLSEGDPYYQVVGELLSREPFGIAIPPSNSGFRDEVDTVLQAIIADGTWQDIYDRWFPDPPPWTLDEMLAEPPVDR